MIDAAFDFAPARDVVVLDLWEGDAPDFDAVRALKVEPARWWLIDAGERVDTIATMVGDQGACTAIGGGLVRATITGPGWRDLLSVSGLFDSHHPEFARGAVVRTVIHHVAVTLCVTGAVTGEESCEVYCAASYAQTLAELWRAATGGR